VGIPLNNIETETIMQREIQEALKPKHKADIVDAGIDDYSAIEAGQKAANDLFSNFIVRTLRVLLR
jgi:hypothetical protein